MCLIGIIAQLINRRHQLRVQPTYAMKVIAIIQRVVTMVVRFRRRQLPGPIVRVRAARLRQVQDHQRISVRYHHPHHLFIHRLEVTILDATISA